MAMDYYGPMKNINRALELYYKVGLEGTDEELVTPADVDDPVDLTFSSAYVRKIKQSCTKFASTFNNGHCQ